MQPETFHACMDPSYVDIYRIRMMDVYISIAIFRFGALQDPGQVAR